MNVRNKQALFFTVTFMSVLLPFIFFAAAFQNAEVIKLMPVSTIIAAAAGLAAITGLLAFKSREQIFERIEELHEQWEQEVLTIVEKKIVRLLSKGAKERVVVARQLLETCTQGYYDQLALSSVKFWFYAGLIAYPATIVFSIFASPMWWSIIPLCFGITSTIVLLAFWAMFV